MITTLKSVVKSPPTWNCLKKSRKIWIVFRPLIVRQFKIIIENTQTHSSSNQYNDRKSNENFNRKQSSNAENCRRCGRSSHIEDKCPAHESGLGMACSNVPLEYVVFAEGQLSDKYGHRHWSLCINYKQR